MKDSVTNDWRIRKNEKLESLFPKPCMFEAIKNKRLQWTGHARRNQSPLLRTVLEKNPTGKRSIGRPRMRREDVVKNDVEELGGGTDWKA